MKFIERVMAAIGVLTLALALLGAFSWWWLEESVNGEASAPDSMVLDLDFSQKVVEEGSQFHVDIQRLVSNEREIRLLDVVSSINRAKDDPRVKGIVALIGSSSPNMAQAQEIRDAILKFRESGKFTYVFAANYGDFGRGAGAYYLASAFENIWLQPIGVVGLSDMGIETPFAKTALEKIGVSGNFLRREEYKSVMENVSRDGFSPPVRDNMEGMLKSLAAQRKIGIARGLDITPEMAGQLISKGPYTADEALSKNLIDRIGHEDEMLGLANLLASQPSGEKEHAGFPSRIAPSQYLSLPQLEKKENKASIALIYGTGVIVDEPEGGPSGISGDNVMDHRKLTEAFAIAADSDDVKAIVFRVDSPGGSPSASETIRRALIRAKKAGKPVFVSMGGVAASGGYWISMDADRIIADPATITGSIGVVAGKFVAGGLWNKLGVKWDSVAAGENYRMMSSLTPFSGHDLERMNAMLDYTYGAFTDGVSVARNIPKDKIPAVAKGRVWTGEQAVSVGLVDELGGLSAAIEAAKEEAKKRAGLESVDSVTLRQIPPPQTPEQFVEELIKRFWKGGVDLGDALSFLGALKAAAKQSNLGALMEAADGGAVSARLPFLGYGY